ncbi:UNVERIFIED_CONTAM: Pentatricopeptide repeat-containing protein [Sesamum calycinum]|uniref:Pentatricopeptide repeat-containing protein n=1 Tax=Sesamum calycinum TaxID=2727403 RepID=A0AAW2MD91_9LAMI
MMLQTSGGSSAELRFAAQAYIGSSSPCKRQTHSSTFNSKLFLGFKSRCNPLALDSFHKYTKISHAQKKSPSRDGFSVGFKLHCHSKIAALPSKNVNKGKKKKYGGILPSVLRALEAEKDVEKALDLYYGKLSPKEQTVILKELSKWDKVVRVFEWFKSQKDYVPNVIHYNVVLRALGRARRWDDLRLCWIEMAKKGVLPTNNTYSMLVDVYGKAGLVKEALLWIKHMKLRGIFPDEVTMSTVVKVLKDAGEYDRADRFYKDWCFGKIELEDLDLDNMGDQQAISLKQFLLSELFRTGGRSHSSADFRHMENSVRKPHLTATYNTLIDLYGKAGRLKDAADVFAVLQCYRNIREAGLFPDDVTYRSVLKILSERNMVEEVEVVIQEMEKLEKRIDESSLPLLAKMYVTAGLSERAKLLVEKLQSYGGFSSQTYAAIIDVYAEKGLWAEAEALFYSNRDACEKKKYVLEYNVMIKAYGKVALYDKAVSLFRDNARELLAEMQEAGFKPSCSTFSAVIASFAKTKRLSDAVDVFQEMLRADVKPNEFVYGLLIDAFAEDGKLEEAKHYFHVMEDSGISANQIILTSMIKAYGKIGSVEGAKQLYEKMKTLDGGPDVVASNSMLNIYAEFGMLSEAKAIFDYLRQKDCADGVTFATMMYVYKNMGMLDEAIEVAEEMKQSGLVRDCVTYNKVMACYATNGQLVECGELLHEMDGRPFAMQAVITSVFSIVGLHAYALESCGTFRKEDVGFSSFAYNAAIRAYVAYGKIDEALNMFMKMQDEGLEPDIVTLINLVNCYGKAGMVEGVKRIHSQLKYGAVEPNESLYKAVIEAYKNANRHELAELVSQEMKFASEAQQFTDSETEDPDETSLAQ